jgi:aminopeptidase N
MTARVARRLTTTGAVLALAAGLLATSGAAAQAAVVGGESAGDSLFPTIGNTGYRVGHYDIRLDYRAATGRIRATTAITARASKALSRYSFDLEGLRVRSVRVDGRSATFSRHDDKLVVTPAVPVTGRFTTVVQYAGKPVTHRDPDGAEDGWIPSKDGGATVLSEPVGAATWFPNNNTPRDKATFSVRVTAPSTYKVAGNGDLAGRRTQAGRTTWHWSQRRQMATYLAMISIGKYQLFHSTMRSTTGRRLPVWSFISPDLGPLKAQRALVPKIVRFEERRYGAYPFTSVGIVVKKLNVGYALETQNRPVFDQKPDTLTLVHELAHQWYGDSVTLRDWQDIWLHEGFATYTEDLWRAAHGSKTTEQLFRKRYDSHPAGDGLWSPAPARFSNPADLFGEPVYTRGGMTLQVLRHRIGSQDFFTVLRRWARQHAYANGTTPQFIALAEQLSGKDLGTLFDDWLYKAERPSGY